MTIMSIVSLFACACTCARASNQDKHRGRSRSRSPRRRPEPERSDRGVGGRPVGVKVTRLCTCFYCGFNSDEHAWPREDGEECCICRLYFKKTVKDPAQRTTTKSDLKKLFKRDPGQRKVWRKSSNWDTFKEDYEAGDLKGEYEWKINSTKKSSSGAKMIGRAFWPKPIYDRYHEDELHIDDIDYYEFRGRTLEGCWRDIQPNQSLPSGVIMDYKAQTINLSHKSDMVSIQMI